MNRILAAIAVAGPLLACGSSSSNDNPPAAADCTSYCNNMAATCTAASDVQYTALTGTCLDYCQTKNAWPAGTPGTTGNTLACRIDHANNAAAAKTAGNAAQVTAHCGHAGPSGGNVCGTWCENYCFLALKNCAAYLGTGANQMGFADAATCTTACAAFPNTGTINSGGNHVQCRIYHAGAAGALAALPHCAHAAVTSGNTFPSTAAGPCN
jgi:hypothetical protein